MDWTNGICQGTDTPAQQIEGRLDGYGSFFRENRSSETSKCPYQMPGGMNWPWKVLESSVWKCALCGHHTSPSRNSRQEQAWMPPCRKNVPVLTLWQQGAQSAV